MNIEDKMKLTIELAEEALKNGEIPIAAMIYLGDEIISCSYASEKADKRYLVHAEIKALMEADKKGYSMGERRKMQLFTTLEPCMMCLGAAMSFCIGGIYYALEAPLDGAVEIAKQRWSESSSEFSIYRCPPVFGGILRNESRELFVKYVEKYENAPMFVKKLSSL
jgi:tRNA(adenine34) deaminase